MTHNWSLYCIKSSPIWLQFYDNCSSCFPFDCKNSYFAMMHWHCQNILSIILLIYIPPFIYFFNFPFFPLNFAKNWLIETLPHYRSPYPHCNKIVFNFFFFTLFVLFSHFFVKIRDVHGVFQLDSRYEFVETLVAFFFKQAPHRTSLSDSGMCALILIAQRCLNSPLASSNFPVFPIP